MKVSEQWVREWVNPNVDAHELAALLTMAGLEVDAINPAAKDFTKVIVAQVITATPHPQADKLTVCEVDTGEKLPLKIVCGAANVRVGLKVALALIGAKLPHLVIKETTLRGELSQGMLCSASELGLSDNSEGIIELDVDAPVGQDLHDYLMLNDHVLDIDLTPNRADCLSIVGIAREIAALTQVPLKSLPAIAALPNHDEKRGIQLIASNACPKYYGRIIRGINARAQTPWWMRERLRRSGIRAIHPVVDVTNYVMLELGQPMHAFDLTQIQGDIVVRFAAENETLTLLDGQTITLQPHVVVIADNQQVLAMAGVMGGSDSGVNEYTMDIFLESAYFKPAAITGIARQYGLNTDSAQRFERGVDPNLQHLALERATELLIEITGGAIGPICGQEFPELIARPAVISFNPQRVKQLTGLTIDPIRMAEMLRDLGMEVNEATITSWQVKAPSHRVDIELDVDLIEEILRLHGYDKIPGEPMITELHAGLINPIEQLAEQAGQFFSTRGYHETISYSFVDPELQDALYPKAKTMSLLNPISSELSTMRTGLWPGLLASMIYNIHRQQTAVKFFENGVIFDLANGTLQEHACIAGLLTGEIGSTSWIDETRQFDFYDLKGDLQALFSFLHWQDIQFIAAEHPALHPGKSARIVHNQQELGWCGVLHPRMGEELGLVNEVILFELKLEPFTTKSTPRYRQISKFPQIRRDLALLVDNTVTAADIELQIKQSVDPALLKAFDVFDIYCGDSIPAGKKSLAVALTLQNDSRTLVDAEINHVISAILNSLEEKFAITLRD